VFAPDDLAVIKGGPSERRRFVDDALVACDPHHDALRVELERVLRQRNALLRSAGGFLDDAAKFTLDVWNTKLVEVGQVLADARVALLERLRPVVSETYAMLSGGSTPGTGDSADGPDARAAIGLTYSSPWRDRGLAEALREAQADDIRRGTTTIGPHRDEIVLVVGGLPARAQASQGEQRTLALALRLAIHRVVTEVTASSPVLLLDDVFSELDPERGSALLANLPAGQVVVTTASRLPTEATPDRIVELVGTVRAEDRARNRVDIDVNNEACRRRSRG
jgi:DNA replication and repair protein RecF